MAHVHGALYIREGGSSFQLKKKKKKKKEKSWLYQGHQMAAKKSSHYPLQRT